MILSKAFGADTLCVFHFSRNVCSKSIVNPISLSVFIVMISLSTKNDTQKQFSQVKQEDFRIKVFINQVFSNCVEKFLIFP